MERGCGEWCTAARDRGEWRQRQQHARPRRRGAAASGGGGMRGREEQRCRGGVAGPRRAHERLCLWREAAATSAALLWLRSAASDGGSSLQRRVRTLPHGEAKPIIASARAACRRQTRGQVRLQRIHPVRSYI